MDVFDSLESRDAAAKANLSVGFLLAPHFTLIAFAGFLAVLRHAGDIGDKSRQVRCHWTVMGREDREVVSSAGVKIAPWEPYRDPSQFDYIVVVGGLLRDDNRYDPEIISYLRLAADKGVNLVGLCTGSFYLAKAGLMQGRKCCVHWYHFQDFIQEFPDLIPVTDEIFITDRDRITCPGGTSVTDLALHLVGQHLGKELVLKCQRHLLLDWGRPHNHPQTPLTNDYSAISDPRVRKAVFLMEQSIGSELSVEELSDSVNTSARQMERLFQDHFGKSPLTYYREMRLKHGRWLLTNTDRTITDIAYECGFADASHFSRWFKNLFGVSPAAERKKAGTASGE